MFRLIVFTLLIVLPICTFAQQPLAPTVPFTRTVNAPARTQNFISNDPSIVELAEQYRRQQAIEWFGQELPTWNTPCVIEVRRGIRQGGATHFEHANSGVIITRMMVSGADEHEIKEVVLPHEVFHSVIHTFIQKPIPRWCDEGVSDLQCSDRARNRDKQMLFKALQDDRGLPLSTMLNSKRYPNDMLMVYWQGQSLCEFFVNKYGKLDFTNFIRYAAQQEANGIGWEKTIVAYYSYPDLQTLQNDWLAWVRNGSPSNVAFQCRDCGTPQHPSPYNPPPPTLRNEPGTPEPYNPPPKPTAGSVKPPTTTDQLNEQTITENVTKNVTENVTNTVTENVTKNVTENVTKNVTESITNSLTEQINKSTSESITKVIEDCQAKFDELTALIEAGRCRCEPPKPEPPVTKPPTESDCKPCNCKPTEPNCKPPERECNCTDDCKCAGTPCNCTHPPADFSKTKRAIYITAENHPYCAETDAMVAKLRDKGFPIDIVRLKEHNVKVGEVPYVFSLPEKRSIIGKSNVVNYLTNLVL